ncbi:hypothetical protein [Bacillus thuringiensis]|nr:hypothetical protein [Bacillus thuringiensis]
MGRGWKRVTIDTAPVFYPTAVIYNYGNLGFKFIVVNLLNKSD